MGRGFCPTASTSFQLPHLNFPGRTQVKHEGSECSYPQSKLLPQVERLAPAQRGERIIREVFCSDSACLVLAPYQGWTMLRKDVCPVRHFLLKRFLLHQPEKPPLMWRASSLAMANVLEAVYLSPALKAATVLKCLLGLRNVKRGNFSLGSWKMLVLSSFCA